MHISTQSITEQKEILERVFDNPKDYILRFYSALTKWEDEHIREILLERARVLLDKTAKYMLQVVFPNKPEPFSQTCIPISTLLHSAPSNMIALWDEMESTVAGDTPFDVDKLNCSMHQLAGGANVSERVSKEFAAITHNAMMQLADASSRPDESSLMKTLKESILRAIDEHIHIEGHDATASKEYLKAVVDVQWDVILPFKKQELEPLCEELVEVFGEEIPDEVFLTQLVQRMQQYLETVRLAEDQRIKMGIPVTEQDRMRHTARSFILQKLQTFYKDGKFPDLIQSFMPNAKAIQGTKVHHKKRKALMEFMNRQTVNTTTLTRQVQASFLHGGGTQNVLMLIHCIYEAQNPTLAPNILGKVLVLTGELNGSDMLALQSILASACNLKTLCLFTNISPTEVCTVIETSSTLRNVSLNIGCYDETLVRTVLSKPTITHFSYSWIMGNEMDRTHSCESFFKCVKGNEHLLELNLIDTKLRNVGAVELARVMNTTQLVEINLTRCGIEEEGIKALSIALVNNHYLNVLHLDDIIITPAGLQSLSHSLKENNTLKVIGLFEDPAMTELCDENLAEFITHLCFNSSVICLVLSSHRIRIPSLKRAVALVNCTRIIKQQPHLSMDDHYTKNYHPEIYNDTGMRASDVRMRALNLINISLVAENDGNFLMKELPLQLWNQTLFSSIQFIEESKAMRNMTMSQLLPTSQTIPINIYVRTTKSIPVVHPLPHQEPQVSMQDQQQTLFYILQSIDKSKSMRNWCMRRLLQQKSQTIQINVLVQEHTSQYPAVVKALQSVTQDMCTQECQQTLSYALHFIAKSKAIRNMCMRQILEHNCQAISIKETVQHSISGCAGITFRVKLCSGCRVTVWIDLHGECHEYVYTVQSVGLLLSVISNMAQVDRTIREIHTSTHTQTKQSLMYEEDSMHRAIVPNVGLDITYNVFYKPSNSFRIFLIYVLHCISTLL